MPRLKEGTRFTVGFQRGQSERSPPRRANKDAAESSEGMRSGEVQTVKTLRSGIVVSEVVGNEASTPKPPTAATTRVGSRNQGLENSFDHANPEPRPHRRNFHRQSRNRRASADYPPGLWSKADSSSEADSRASTRTSKAHASRRNGVSLKEEFEVAKKMEDLKACKTTQRWLNKLSFTHLQLEKEKADEQNRQMQLQTQALIEERAKIKAEKEALERTQNEMMAKIQLLENIYQTSDQEYLASEDNDSGREESFSASQRWADTSPE